MARYIDADKLIFQLRQNQMWTKSRDLTEAIITVQNQPTADVEEVVRCKDCDIPHNKWTGCPKMNGLIPPPNHFCSYGERKDT